MPQELVGWRVRPRVRGTRPRDRELGECDLEPGICLGCGCLCDDVAFDDAGRYAECELGERWFAEANSYEACRIAASPASLSKALAKAITLLGQARRPLVYGLQQCGTGEQRAAVDAARAWGAALDTATSAAHGPSILAAQATGKVTCTLAEVRRRCDIAIFWGADPLVTHPRLLSHHTLNRPGEFAAGGRADRYVIVVDEGENQTADQDADLAIRIAPGASLEAIWVLRGLLAEAPLDPAEVLSATGVALETWQSLHRRVVAARYGSLLYGKQLMSGPAATQNVIAALSWVRDLNRKTRFVARSLRSAGSISGADQVLLWKTGLPFAIDFAPDRPRFDPYYTTALGLLRRCETDLLIAVGADTAAFAALRTRVESLPPLVWIGPAAPPEGCVPDVEIATQCPGVDGDGVVYRLDEVPLRARARVHSARPNAAELLSKLASEAIGEGAGKSAKMFDLGARASRA